MLKIQTRVKGGKQKKDGTPKVGSCGYQNNHFGELAGDGRQGRDEG